MRSLLRYIRKSPLLYSVGFLTILAAALASCKMPGWDTDLAAFVDYGRTIAYLDSASYVQGSAATNTDVRAGMPVTVTVQLNNPKALALAYTISVDSSLVDGTVEAPSSTTGAADGITTISFSFTPTAAAEHGDIEFKLGLSAPSINRTFDPATFKVHCDSPPASVNNLTAGIRTDGRACIGFTLPEDYANADIAKAEITYTSSTAGTTRTVTEDVSPAGTGLTTVPAPAPLSSSAGKYVRYYLPDDVIAGNQYTFTVTPIDASGKKCESATSASLKGTELYLGYDANGATGTVAAKYGYNLTTSATIADSSSLSRDGYGFTGWNTKADGTGTTYNPGASYTFGTSSLMLYAQWMKLATVTVAITIPGYQSTSVQQNGETVTSLTMDKDGTLTLTMPLPSGATNYRWYLDSTATAVATTISWSFRPTLNSITSGTHIITGTADYTATGGSTVSYSSRLVVTVTNDALVPVIPYGSTSTYHMESLTAGTTYTDIYVKLSPYSIAKTETTYSLWAIVYAWATAHGYTFAHAGSSNTGSTDVVACANYPVGNISWRDAIVWCNAYSEMTNHTPCYTYNGSIIRDSSNATACDNATFIRTNDGYRLPTEAEWQYAASGREEVSYDMVSGCPISALTNPQDQWVYAVYSWDKSWFFATYVARVKPNRLGLFDMSGLSWEFCCDRYASPSSPYDSGTSASAPAVDYCKAEGTNILNRSGSWGVLFSDTIIGKRFDLTTVYCTPSGGFRIARTIPQ